MAYVDPGVAGEPAGGAGEPADSKLAVDVRGRAEAARLTPLPFYHRKQDQSR
jgi:hypothetical protein